jgi:hypothetical protein
MKTSGNFFSLVWPHTGPSNTSLRHEKARGHDILFGHPAQTEIESSPSRLLVHHPNGEIRTVACFLSGFS